MCPDGAANGPAVAVMLGRIPANISRHAGLGVRLELGVGERVVGGLALLWPWPGLEIFSCGLGLGLRSVIAFTLGFGFEVRCRLGLRFRFGSAYLELLVSGLVWVLSAALLSGSASPCGWQSSCPGIKGV